MRTVAFALAIAVLASPAVAAQATAGGAGFAISPAEINVPGSLLRGGQHEVSFRLQNAHDYPVTVTPSGVGAIGAWIQTDPASAFTMAPATARTLRVIIAVPADAANGPYEGAVRIGISGHSTSSEAGSVASVNMAFEPAIRLTVGGDEVRRLAFEGARALDSEAGNPVTFVFDVVNTGNVRAAPAFAVAIEDAEGRTVLRETLTGVEIAPGARAAMALATSKGFPEGDHEATASLAADGEPRPREGLAFTVHPPGTLARSEGKSGVLNSVTADARPKAGSVVKITGEFASDSKRPIDDARLSGEILRDGERIALLEGDSIAVLPGTTRALEAYWTATGPGVYRAKVWINYDGLRTEARDVDVIVEPASGKPGVPSNAGGKESATQDEKPKGIPGPGVLAIGGLAVAAAWAFRRRD